jgi:transposase
VDQSGAGSRAAGPSLCLSTRTSFEASLRLLRATGLRGRDGEVGILQQTQDGDGLAVERVAALDIGKAEVVCCVRVPGVSGGRRAQEVATHSTMTRSLQVLADRLAALRVTRMVMEATSDWKAVFYLLEACTVAERDMLRPSFVPPEPIRMLRDLTGST